MIRADGLVKRYGRFAADSHDQWGKMAKVSTTGPKFTPIGRAR